MTAVQLTLTTVTRDDRSSWTTVHASPDIAWEALRLDYADVDFGPSDDDLVFLEQLEERCGVTVRMEVVTLDVSGASTARLRKQWTVVDHTVRRQCAGDWSVYYDRDKAGPQWHLVGPDFRGYFVTDLAAKMFAEQYDAGVLPAVMAIRYEEEL